MPPTFPLQFGRYREIASHIAERLSAARGDDLLARWPEEVIVASRGVAESISRALVERHSRPVAALQLQTLETLAQRLLNDAGEYPRVASDAERRLAMRAAARSIDDPMMTSRGIASMLERSYRDVRDSNLTLDDLRKRADRARLRNRDRMRLIVRAFTEYERLINAIGAIDPADLFTRASKHCPSAAPQIVAGFYDMTGVQLAFIEALNAAGKIAAVHAPVGDDDSYRFAQPFIAALADGAAIEREAMLSIKRAQWSVAVHDRRDVEIESVCDAIARLIESGTPPQSIGIVARSFDDADVHLFNRYASALGFRTSRRDDLPLLTHRLGRAIAAILRLRERGFRRGEVLEIVRDGFRAQTRIDVDEADLKTRERRIAGGTSDELRAATRRPQIINDYIELVAELESLTSRIGTPLRGKEWSDLLLSLASRFHFESDRDLLALQCVDEAASLFERADRMNVRFDVAAVIDALEQQSITEKDDDARPRVWLGDVMTFRGRAFDHVFAVRMQDDSFPQRRLEDALLPDSDRRLLGVREVGDGAAEEQMLFRLLFDGSSSSVHFSLASSDGFGKSLRASQLLKNFVIEEEPERKEALLNDFAKVFRSGGQAILPVRTGKIACPPLRPLQLLARAGTNSTFDAFITDEALRERFAKALEGVTPTQLEDFGECPQKFFLEHILDVDDLDDPDRELQINPRDKGSIDHRILEQFYRALTDDDYDEARREMPILPKSLVSRLDDVIDHEFDRAESEAPPFNRNIRAIERRATKRILRDFVSRDFAELTNTGLQPRHFEYTFGAKFLARGYRVDHLEPFVVSAAGVPIRIEGKIDRVDSDGTKFRIVDYKSGKALRHSDLGKKIDRGVRLQLATYAMAVAEFFGVDPANVSGTIKPVVAGDAKPASFAFELAQKRFGLQETLDTFASAILRGRFPAFPNERDGDFNSCKYCAVKLSCRTKHDPEERYAVTRANEPRTLLQRLE